MQREQHQRMSATMLLMLMHSPTNPGFLALIPILIFFSRCRSVAVIERWKIVINFIRILFHGRVSKAVLDSALQSESQSVFWTNDMMEPF